MKIWHSPRHLCTYIWLKVGESVMKTPKLASMYFLESTPSTIDVQVIDAVFFFHFYSELQQTFDGIAEVLFKKVLHCDGHITHFILDK